MDLHCLPDDLKIDVAVVVDYAVAHSNDSRKRDVGKCGAGLGRQARRRFADNQQPSEHRILCPGVLKELLMAEPGEIFLDRLYGAKDVEQYATCLGGIDLPGRSKDRAAADGVMVLFDRAAGEQIDPRAEHGFQFVLKCEELPA